MEPSTIFRRRFLPRQSSIIKQIADTIESRFRSKAVYNDCCQEEISVGHHTWSLNEGRCVGDCGIYVTELRLTLLFNQQLPENGYYYLQLRERSPEHHVVFEILTNGLVINISHFGDREYVLSDNIRELLPQAWHDITDDSDWDLIVNTPPDVYPRSCWLTPNRAGITPVSHTSDPMRSSDLDLAGDYRCVLASLLNTKRVGVDSHSLSMSGIGGTGNFMRDMIAVRERMRLKGK